MRSMVMGRVAFGFGLVWALAVGSTAFSLSACSSDPTAEPSGEKGTIDLALSGTSSSGIVYRLRDAQIDITGASTTSLSTEDFLDQTEISLELLAGGYLADLLPGWRLERLIDGEFEDVRALLISTDPLPFTVVDQETTDVRLRFRAGDDVVELGNGRVVIGIDVIDEFGPPTEGCEQACELAVELNPECSDITLCVDACSNLGGLLAGTGCEPFGDMYVACAEGQPGEAYFCDPALASFPVVADCLFELEQVAACLSGPPCDFDDDGDGVCQNQGDCDDSDPDVFPGAPDLCGDMIDQNCNGVDDCVPPSWTCAQQFYGTADGCDCGCGEFDPDCIDTSSAACEFCDQPGSCAEGLGCGVIDSSWNPVCTGVVCELDQDGDSFLDCQDCNDSDASVFPGAPEVCGDGVDQDCDGADLPCNPGGWTCNPGFYGADDGCDCGCGEPDPDCGGDPTVSACEFCGEVGSCSEGLACPGTINPMDNTSCL